MKQYQELLKDVLENGTVKGDRTGTGTRSVFGRQIRMDLSKGFPLLTTKKMFTKAILHELLWIISGDTNIQYLKDNGVKIWDQWANENGDLGPVYGQQWRSWSGGYCNHDQLYDVIYTIRTNPDCRRMLVTSWNPDAIERMALPPCHCLFQFYVADGKLSCQLYQRSADIFLGVPFNIASYAALTHMIAQVCDLEVGEFVHTFGDLHLYNNHVDQAYLQLERQPKPLPQLLLNPDVTDIDAFEYEDFVIQNYVSHPTIKGDVSV